MNGFEIVQDMAAKSPFTMDEIEPIYIACRISYWPQELAVKKCEDIIEFSCSANISLTESYKLQVAIDSI